MTQLKLRIKHNNNIRKFLQFALKFKCFLRYQLYDSKNCYMFYLNMQGDYGAVSCFFQRQRRYPHKIDEKIQRHTFLVVSFIAARDTSGFSRTMYLSKGPVQMPWWGLLFAGVLAFGFTLPISIITATTNQVKILQLLLPYNVHYM